MGVDDVSVIDRQLHRIADIRFRTEEISFELDESENCGQIGNALTVLEIKEIIRNRRKEGWKPPKFKIRDNLSPFDGSCFLKSNKQ